MDAAAWVDGRRGGWVELERLLDVSEERGFRALSWGEARAVARLYRRASADLLYARAHRAPAEVTEYLNDLVARAYAATSPGKRLALREAWTFVAHGFPALLAREHRMVLVAAALFLAGGLFGWLGMWADPDAAPYLVPADHLALDPVKRAAREAAGDIAGVQQQAAFTSFLFTHNIQVAFLCFALGLTFGLGTALALFVNGLLLGALAQVYQSKGLGLWFWAWILPHGIPEVTAICIAGGAGLVLARGLVAPRGRERRLAVREEAGRATRLVLGTMPLFVVAGIVEGTVSQIHEPHLPSWLKVGFAVALGTAVFAYLGSAALAARRRGREPRLTPERAASA